MPEAFTIGPLLVSTRTTSVVISLLLAIWISGYVSRSLGRDSSWTLRTAEGCAWLGIVAARLSYVAINWDAFSPQPWTVLFFWQPGYSPLGGVAAGIVYLVYRLQSRPAATRRGYLVALSAGYLIGASLLIGVLATMNRFTGADVLRPGQAVANFALHDMNEKVVRFASLRGKAIVLNFWATWCPPCRREMPLLDTVHQEFQEKGVVILGVAVGETAGDVRPFVDSIGVSYPIWVNPVLAAGTIDDSSDVYRRFGGVGLPTTWFIDSDGIAESSYVGELNLAILRERIRGLLPDDPL